MNPFERWPPLAALAANADHVDVKTFVSSKSLPEFIAALFSYQPGWITFLYGVRFLFVRLLGMKQTGIPQQRTVRPEEISMVPGATAAFFRVKTAVPDQYWVAEAAEAHLTAQLGIAVEPLDGLTNRFYLLTIVHYNSWAGPIYFNVIRPFHHLVVGSMGRFASRSTPHPTVGL